MASYDLTYRTHGGRCLWCYAALGETESHTVVSALRPPPLDLHFHHSCWPAFAALVDWAQPDKTDWTPQKVEELRIRLGANVSEFCRKLHMSPSRLRRYLGGDETALGPSHLRLLRSLSRQAHFDRAAIDWTDNRAVFCLMRYMNVSIIDLARQLKGSQTAIKGWLEQGVPRSRPNTWMKLDRLAQQHGFDAGMIVDDRNWTAALLDSAMDAAGVSISRWATLAGLSEVAVRGYRAGRLDITRVAAWRLTRAAIQLGAPLPPAGLVAYVRPEQHRHIPKERKKRWTPEMVALLGTMPDSAAAQILGLTTSAVSKHRIRLGIAAHQPIEKAVCYWLATERRPHTPVVPAWYSATLDSKGLVLSTVKQDSEEEARRAAEGLAAEKDCPVFAGSPAQYKAKNNA